MGVLDFLRDVGKHVTVNTMLAKESVRARVQSEAGISFTEFSYMLLQANDYRHLHEELGVELQVGGSDQWGNITAGIDLIRRTAGDHVHGLTVPLVTRADGAKFGKSAEGAVWLSPERTTPYAFFQYFVNVDDRDVERFLLQLTLLPVAEVAEVMQGHAEAPEQRQAQQALARAVTTLVHGETAALRAEGASQGFTRAATELGAEEWRSWPPASPRWPSPPATSAATSSTCWPRRERWPRRAKDAGSWPRGVSTSTTRPWPKVAPSTRATSGSAAMPWCARERRAASSWCGSRPAPPCDQRHRTSGCVGVNARLGSLFRRHGRFIRTRRAPRPQPAPRSRVARLPGAR